MTGTTKDKRETKAEGEPLVYRELVTTWYATGEELPWRLEWHTEDEPTRYSQSCATFADLLLALGEVWARAMPEPLRFS